MKKRLLLLSGIGIGGGLLYLLNRGGRAADRNNRPAKGAAEGDTDASLRSSDISVDDGGERSNGRATPQSSMGMSGNGKEHENLIIDDQGTDQAEASHILQKIRDTAFESSDEKLALALGRPTEEIEEWTSGSGIIDGDVVMKARGLAIQRGIEIE
ncbi:MAG TPA: hypothetical protein VK582_17730 [Pyrinomonadaceae bacterium]|nr:hypothetical protein [Pyrinomonadaceae bacterium]